MLEQFLLTKYKTPSRKINKFAEKQTLSRSSPIQPQLIFSFHWSFKHTFFISRKVFVSMWVNGRNDLNFATCDPASNNLEDAFMLGKMSSRTTYFKRFKFRYFSSLFNFASVQSLYQIKSLFVFILYTLLMITDDIKS